MNIDICNTFEVYFQIFRNFGYKELKNSDEDALGEVRIVGEVINMQADEAILNEQGEVDLDKLQPLSYDSSERSYRVLGETVGKAFKDGNLLKDKTYNQSNE